MVSDKLKKIFDSDNLGLLEYSKRNRPQTSSDRLESSFLEINDFFNENNREPEIMSTDMLEHRLGVRLRGIRADDDKVECLKHLDINNLLIPEDPPENIDEVFSDDELGLFDDPTGILTMTNVPSIDRTRSDFVAKRQAATDFTQYEPLFRQQHKNLVEGVSKLIKFMGSDTIKQGRFFIVNGLMVYVDNVGEKTMVFGRPKERIHCIFENGTESDMFLRSLASQLYEDGGYSVVDSVNNEIGNEDSESGYIYILSSLSEDPKIRNLSNLYKIGFSTTSVEQRIRNVANDPTYLLAPVKIVATYKTYNMNTQKFELLLHRIFSEARLDMDLVDKSGSRYVPTEWFIVPINVIDTAIRMIISGDIINYTYDASSKSIIETGS